MPDLYTAAKVDFNKVTGKLRHEQHGCNSCPNLYMRSLIDFSSEFKKMNFHSTRTHDWALWNSGQRIIDTHFVFPLMKLDPADPTNYYFRATDDIIKLAHSCNMNIFYRMGTSIEHSSCGGADEHYNTLVPDDFEKYAEVLAGIIRHYTAGWADGFQYQDMKYWEIWNEPDLGGRMWCGTQEQFVKFFVTVLKRLKNEFPHLKIGGPALCGINRDYIKAILDGCRKENIVPDFISVHSYTSDVEYLASYPDVMRELLDSQGFNNTEICVNEWHYIVSWDGVQASASFEMRRRAMEGPCGLHGIDSGCFNLAVLSSWQSKPLDSAFYYGASLDGSWGFRDELRRENKNSHSMKMFGRFLNENEKTVEAESYNKTVYVIGAKNKNSDGGAIIVTDYRGESRTLEIEVNGMQNAKNVSACVLDSENDIVPVPVIWENNRLTLIKNSNGSAAFHISFS